MDHRFRRARVAFDGNQEWCQAPSRPTGEEILQMGEERARYIAKGVRPNKAIFIKFGKMEQFRNSPQR